MRIDAEPRPRDRPLAWRDPLALPGPIHPLPRGVLAPEVPFFAVLTSRSSAAGSAPVTENALASVLWHATLLRERRPTGRFGLPWESRNAPSAGGLHPLRLLVVPIGAEGISGMYDPANHGLVPVQGDDRPLRETNAASVAVLAGVTAGTTIQIVADPTKTSACYENADGLVVRDAGAIVMTMCLVATALGLASVPLGRAGTEIVRSAGLPSPLVGLGAIHLTAV